MLIIRLSRKGTNKRPFYHLMVTDSRHSRDGRYTECVGYFNPIAAGGDKRLDLKTDRIEHWLKQGAQPTARVKSLIKESKKVAVVQAQ
jgi:small subunit ribosomal protein S16